MNFTGAFLKSLDEAFPQKFFWPWFPLLFEKDVLEYWLFISAMMSLDCISTTLQISCLFFIVYPQVQEFV